MIVNEEQQEFFDPSTGQKKNKLVISYVNKEHKISYLQYIIPENQMFSWKYTTKKFSDKNWASFDNKPIKPIPTQKLDKYRINEILCSFGDKVNPIFEMNIPETWFCDIETDVTDDGFPDSEHAANQINTIAITKFPKTIVFGRKSLSKKQISEIQNKFYSYSELTKDYQFEYKEFDNEYQMLIAFIEFIIPIPALTGWNFLGYDWNYIYNRCKNIGINLDVLSTTGSFNLFKTTLKNGSKVKSYIPMHKIIYDYMLVYKQWDHSIEPKENFTLDWTAEAVLGIKKVQHNMGFQEFYKDYYADYVFYNAIDTILVEQIDKKLKTANVWYMMASILRIELNTAFSTIVPVETVMSTFIYPQHKVIVKNNFKKPESASYEGAFVWPTIPGIYKNIGGLDFASLYPSTMRQFQISCENFLFKDTTGKYKPKSDEIKCKSGAVFKKDKDATLPAILTYYYAQRKFAKKQKKQANTDYEKLKHILSKRMQQEKNAG